MNKKIIGIVFLVLSVLVFGIVLTQVIRDSATRANASWHLDSNYKAIIMDKRAPEADIDQVRSYLFANPDYENTIFSETFYKQSRSNPEEAHQQALSIAKTLGFTFEEETGNYGGYDFRTHECYWLPNGVGLIQVTETHDYYYRVNVNREKETTGSFIWTLEDGVGSTVFQVTDLSASTQGKVTLEPGIYYLYDAYENLRDVDVKLRFAKQ